MQTARKFNPTNDNPGGSDLVVLEFHGNKLLTFDHDGVPYVAMRSVCDGMGIDWSTQRKKLLSESGKFNCGHITTVGGDGKGRQMISMPVRKLPLWLASINPNKIGDPVKRERIVLYQEESAIALHDYWTHGAAVRGDGMQASVGIEQMVKKFVMEAMAEFTRQIVPQLVEQQLACNPQIGAVTSVPALQVAIEKGVKVRPRGFIQAISNALTRYCESRPNTTVLRDVYGRKLFPREAINEWMAKGGWGPMKDRLDRQKVGQSVFKLVPGGHKK
ncbi:phage antirepressor N-terminal domain-containing protein [uncultured Thalassospira sp.]|uniref:phage antirepressor N-terminal domain-containing protein n=1 Tax=uncultured Thalassospira sp. TaxID=404382 RepID=UPI0030DCB981|tara:strand:+ start:32424 stop:33245 length:822 start_codon:yes stop_codon:yes gene_type:complete